MSRTKGRARIRAAQMVVLAVVFGLGVTVPALVGPAFADDPPPTTTTTTDVTPTTTPPPNPDPAPQPAPAPAKPKQTTKKTTTRTTAPAPTTTTTRVVPAPQPVVPASTPAPVKPLAVRTKPTRPKASKPKHVRKAPVKARPVKKHPAAADRRVTPPLAPVAAGPAVSTGGSSETAHALKILLLALPVLLLLAGLVPPSVVPSGMALEWHTRRGKIALIGGALLFVQALIYLMPG